MSSITFPNAGHPLSGPSSALSESVSELEYFSGPFQNASTNSFQINPLSSHPPRTPRTSTVSKDYGGDIYTPKEELIEQQTESVLDDEEDKTYHEARNRVRKEDVWHDLLKTAYGRDKTFKAIQYSMRLYLLFHTTISSSPLFGGRTRQPWETAIVKRFESAIGGFSLTRKCLILFNWLGPLTSILAQHSSDDSFSSARSPKSASKPKPLLYTFLHASPPVLLDLVNGISDDIYTLHRLGLISKRIGERAGYYADWCWFFTTLVNLVENGVERSLISEQEHQVESRLYTESMSGATAKSNPTATKLDEKELARLQRQDHWIVVSRIKLLMDLIFVSYNVFNLKRAKRSVQTVTGLTAALLSTAKAYERHKTLLVKEQKY